MQKSYFLQQKQLIKKIRNSLSRSSFGATVVPLQKDYEHDDRICLTLIAFVPKNISQKIVKNIIVPLKNIESDHFYYSPELMHLTIKNIRIINKPPTFTDKNIIRVDQLFKELIPKFPLLTFHLEDLLLLPTSVSLIGYCNNNIKKLIQELGLGLKKVGVPDNKKYFSNKVFFNNVTVCRFTHKPTGLFLEKLKELENIKIGELNIRKINLITCNAVYSSKTRKIISEYQLKK